MTRSYDNHTIDALSRWEGEGGSLSASPEIHQAIETSGGFTTPANARSDRQMTLTDMDRWRLSRFLTCSERAGYGSPQSRLALEARLEEAKAIPAQRAPRSLVTMNSTVRLVDLESGAHKVRTLAYPEDCDLIPQSVGVLQPLGQRILGRHKGDVVGAFEGGMSRRFRIDSIEYQPEAAGAYQL